MYDPPRVFTLIPVLPVINESGGSVHHDPEMLPARILLLLGRFHFRLLRLRKKLRSMTMSGDIQSVQVQEQVREQEPRHEVMNGNANGSRPNVSDLGRVTNVLDDRLLTLGQNS